MNNLFVKHVKLTATLSVAQKPEILYTYNLAFN